MSIKGCEVPERTKFLYFLHFFIWRILCTT
nr:MAG TPA: hypothetical protein [Caudoviricetes sp.]